MHMRHMLIVLGIVLAAILVGAGFYFYGPSEFRETPPLENAEASALGADVAAAVPFRILAEGTDAEVEERKNFAAYDEDGLARLWAMAYGEDAPPVPSIDFASEYVIGVFAGEKATGGHAIRVASVTDENSLRNVGIAIERPAQGCMTTQALTRPFQVIAVPFSERELARTDSEKEVPCR
jgi:hypothetical protein